MAGSESIGPPEAAADAETEVGRALFAELLWVHRMIRRDLEAVRELAEGVRRELAPNELRDGLQHLEANGPIWWLRGSCLRHCHFVHSHHHAEDVLLFPTLRRANPALEPVVDRLEADHRMVSQLLDAVEAAADALSNDDSAATRDSVAGALDELARHLLEHLEFEELHAGRTIRGLASWRF